MSIVGIVLAAGGSSRMGSPKQLLNIDGQPAIRRVTEQAIASVCDEVTVVLGAEEETIAAALDGLDTLIVNNASWTQGIGASIAAGVKSVRTKADLEAIVLLLADQPAVTSNVIDELVRRYRSTGSEIVASQYGDTAGAPALFDAHHFDELCDLSGDHGAKRIIAAHHERVSLVPFDGGEIDLDTPDDVANYQSQACRDNR